MLVTDRIMCHIPGILAIDIPTVTKLSLSCLYLTSLTLMAMVNFTVYYNVILYSN